MTKLDELVSIIESEHVYIQTHNFPDPDAISSAYGLQKLLATRNIHSTICYEGKIDRHNTRKMLELFNIQAYEVCGLTRLSEDDEIILIDAQKENGNTSNIIGDEIASIDHHPTNKVIEYRFSDIRTNVGACASIIASYFFENNIPMDSDVAECLLYGITIDTADMTRGVSNLDLDMFYSLFQATGRKKISLLASEVMQLEDLKAFASAIDSIRIFDNIGISNTGYNCPEALIATVADFILQIVGVNVALVYSIKKTGVKLSVRCTKMSGIHAGKVMIQVLKNLGTGGGHSAMAGGFVPVGEDADTAYVEELLEEIRQRFVAVVNEKDKVIEG